MFPYTQSSSSLYRCFPKRAYRFAACAWLAVILLTVASCQQSAVFSSTGVIDPIAAPFPMPVFRVPQFPELQFDITAFGGVEGGVVKNTRAIQQAIDSAAAAGGGSIIIPPGKWLTGAIHLENNVNLHLAKDAELLFSQDRQDYLPVVFSRHEDIECYKYSAFIYAEGKSNIAITGEGTLNGQGKPWWSLKEKKLEAGLYDLEKNRIPVNERIYDGRNGNELRPAFFQPMSCKKVFVEGVTFLYGAFWTITPTYCEDVVVRNVRIVTEGEYGHTPNGDGVDPSSCKNVLIENCEFDTGDDCIAIKAGRDEDGIRVGKATENVVVRNCRGHRGHGGIVIGSETSGGVRNVYAVNCRFDGTDRIVRLKTARGRGGALENMWFKDLSGANIINEAIHLNMLYTGSRLPVQPVTNTTPSMRNIHFDHITCTSGKSYAIELLGIPERPIEDISFDSIDASTAKGVHLADAKGIRISQSIFRPDTAPVVSIFESSDIILDAVAGLNASGRFLRVEGASSRGIRVRNMQVSDPSKSISQGPDVSADAVRIEE